MRENLSAPGNVSDWLKITRQAFENLNYYNIMRDPRYARMSARYGYDEYIIVNIRSKDENKVLLEFDVSSPHLIDQYKTASAQIVRKIQKSYQEKQRERQYGVVPTDNINPAEVNEVYQDVSQDTSPAYKVEDGDFIEQTRHLPDDTLQLKQYRKDIEKLEEDSLKHKFRQTFDKLWLIWLMLVVFPPFGIFLLWYFKRMGLLSRIVLTTLSFLFFFLFWIGLFGINTGVNKENIQKFYNTQQYNIQRFFDQFNPGTDPDKAIESVTPEVQEPTVPEPGVIQEDRPDVTDDLTTIFSNIRNFFRQFSGSPSGDGT